METEQLQVHTYVEKGLLTDVMGHVEDRARIHLSCLAEMEDTGEQCGS